MQSVKINLKIKHQLKNKELHQNILISSYNDYFLTDTYKFFRHLKDFVNKFKLNYSISYITEGITNYQVVYNIDNIEKVEYNDLDETFEFPVTDKDKRNCLTCECYDSEKKYCNIYEKDIDIIPATCYYWFESDEIYQ
jgi:hypothetical protein